LRRRVSVSSFVVRVLGLVSWFVKLARSTIPPPNCVSGFPDQMIVFSFGPLLFRLLHTMLQKKNRILENTDFFRRNVKKLINL